MLRLPLLRWIWDLELVTIVILAVCILIKMFLHGQEVSIIHIKINRNVIFRFRLHINPFLHIWYAMYVLIFIKVVNIFTRTSAFTWMYTYTHAYIYICVYIDIYQPFEKISNSNYLFISFMLYTVFVSCPRGHKKLQNLIIIYKMWKDKTYWRQSVLLLKWRMMLGLSTFGLYALTLRWKMDLNGYCLPIYNFVDKFINTAYPPDGHYWGYYSCFEALATPSLWRHNRHNGVSNHQPHDCLLNRLFRRRSKKTSKLSVTGLCAGNSPGTGEFPARRASNAENVSIWWRHHAF